MHSVSLDALSQKVLDGARISVEEALALEAQLPLPELGALAHERRRLKKADAYGGRGNEIVTYLVDRNINYTNVCNVYCKFCAFYRLENHPDSYVITHDELRQKVEELVALGGNQVLLQGGHHPKLGLDFYLDMLGFLRKRFPTVNIHGFSPPEFNHFHEVFQMPVREVLRRFKDAGLGSIPGGGGEILVDRVRRRIAPLKCDTNAWLSVMREAHALGLRSSATMMFGHVETAEDRLEHLRRLRDLQDETGGFTAFIGWTFQDENTKLRVKPAGAHAYLRTQAIARIFLDNFDNVQSSWVTQGPKIGQIALQYGANDLGSTMLEENVVSSAGASWRMTVPEMRRLIADLGYEPHQRDNWYRLVDLAA
ncbi:MAG: dehypoxanthine futalosine cyclase [Verrucomicrobiae bacterium]|nr:dehypoxanthine futalosine cyclase [Verrucomicrobiae bacterium]